VGDYLRAVLLGLLQALSEFLPISSSGHLLLAGTALGDDAQSLTFDVGLHTGTTAAVLVYFWHDWRTIVAAVVRDGTRHGARVRRWGPAGRLGAWIALGTLPAVGAGLLAGETIEAELRQAWLVAVLLIGFALPLAASERAPVRRSGLEQLSAWQALAIGGAQAVALLPGVSRLGITISAARGLGFDHATAARFSFLLSAPAIVVAATLAFAEVLLGDEVVAWGPLLLGALVSGVAGGAVIHWLLRYVRTGMMWPFVWYRIALGLAVLSIAAVRAA